MKKSLDAAIQWVDLHPRPALESAAPTIYRILLAQTLYDDILRHAKRDLARECIGLLLGHPASARATRILAAPPALAATASPTHVVLNAEAWPASGAACRLIAARPSWSAGTTPIPGTAMLRYL